VDRRVRGERPLSALSSPSGIPTPPQPSGEEAAPIIFGRPYIGEEEIAEVVDTLRSGWLGTGPKTKRFEFRFATYVNSSFAIATNSGTAALHLALDALGVGPGDEILTTPLTFVATANVAEHCGATPVFADVRPYDGNIDPSAVARAVTPATKAVIPVHYAGAAADVPAIRHGHPEIPIVVDAAHAVETTYAEGASSSGHGATFTAFSFYVTKNLVTGEGGMLVTDDEHLAETARVRSLHGLDNDAWKRYASGFYGEYELQYPGFKYNMTDLQASLGIHQLERIERAWSRRAEIWERYNHAFTSLPGVTIPPVSLADGLGRHARHLYTLWLDWHELGFDRRHFVVALKDLGIGTGWHFRALHLQRHYREKYDYAPGDFPVAEWIADRTVSLPLSAALSDADVDRVIAAVRTVVTAPTRPRRQRSRRRPDTTRPATARQNPQP
jgi:dTDP-4-amino-4,6-dideoxygalactose transaminase